MHVSAGHKRDASIALPPLHMRGGQMNEMMFAGAFDSTAPPVTPNETAFSGWWWLCAHTHVEQL
jgi:hypothetical protein